MGQEQARMEDASVDTSPTEPTSHKQRSRLFRLTRDFRALGTALVLVPILDFFACRIQDHSSWLPTTTLQQALIQYACVGVIVITMSAILRYSLRLPFLAIIRSELDRRQKGEAWALEGPLALSLYPTLATWLCSTGWWRLASSVHLLLIVFLFYCLYSPRELRHQIRRFTPGFGTGRLPKTTNRLPTSRLLLVLLIGGSFPVVSRFVTQIRDRAGAATVAQCNAIAKTVVNEQFVEAFTGSLVVAVYVLFSLLFTAWVAWSTPLALNVLVHAHLSTLEGHRFARIRELFAGTALIAISVGVLGNEMLRSSACAIALLTLACLKITTNAHTVEKYLLRMRQLR